MAVSDKKYSLEDLQIGMMVKAEQLSEIYDKYIIILYEDTKSKIGKLVYCGDTQDNEYDNWFMQTKPITPIYNNKSELEDMIVYDE